MKKFLTAALLCAIVLCVTVFACGCKDEQTYVFSRVDIVLDDEDIAELASNGYTEEEYRDIVGSSLGGNKIILKNGELIREIGPKRVSCSYVVQGDTIVLTDDSGYKIGELFIDGDKLTERPEGYIGDVTIVFAKE